MARYNDNGDETHPIQEARERKSRDPQELEKVSTTSNTASERGAERVDQNSRRGGGMKPPVHLPHGPSVDGRSSTVGLRPKGSGGDLFDGCMTKLARESVSSGPRVTRPGVRQGQAVGRVWGRKRTFPATSPGSTDATRERYGVVLDANGQGSDAAVRQSAANRSWSSFQKACLMRTTWREHATSAGVS